MERCDEVKPDSGLTNSSFHARPDSKLSEAYVCFCCLLEYSCSLCQIPAITKTQLSSKEQGSAVERGFRFLKDPLFFADSLFLKSPARIMAMIMIMGLALLVYALAERQLRHQLAAHNETIPDQKGQPTQTPTMRRVAQIFEGVDILTIRQHHQVVARQVLNLTELRRRIVSLLGPEVQYCYLVDF